VAIELLAASALVPPMPKRAAFLALIPAAFLLAIAWLGTAVPQIAAAAIVTAALLTAGTIIGSAIGTGIDKPGHLLIVAAISALVDVYSVLHPTGPTANLIRIEQAVSVLILPWPILGTDRIEPVIGFGDVAFCALYCAAARKHALSMPRTVVALAFGLALTLVVVMVFRIGIPALPFLGVAIVIAHPEARRLPKEDRVRAAIGLGVLAAIVALLFVLR
jgi:hypothetical protein